MKDRMMLWVAVLMGLWLAGSVCIAADADTPVVTPHTGVSGPWCGHKVGNSVYQSLLSCNTNYGLHSFTVNLGGEEVMQTTRFAIYDKSQCLFDSFEFHKNKEEIIMTTSPGNISWALSPEFAGAKGLEYSGSLAYEPRKLTYTHTWTWRKEVKGRFLAGNLKLGIPLLTGCPFEATLVDDSVVKGEIPAELPEKETRFTPYTGAGKSIKSVLFHTKKGKVRITFVPDKHLDMEKGCLLFLRTILHTYPDRDPYRRYELTLGFPLGSETKDVPRSYSVVFEFPE